MMSGYALRFGLFFPISSSPLKWTAFAHCRGLYNPDRDKEGDRLLPEESPWEI